MAIADERQYLRGLVFRLQLIEEIEQHERVREWTLACRSPTFQMTTVRSARSVSVISSGTRWHYPLM
ncbi:hypothetical protein [uncultured Amnibacterium sp.]|uniref:hypothetical protein n=1 Tax=uncultured Amnibacterium sp. TaxID=1631851 RepID=UPI0035CB9FCB